MSEEQLWSIPDDVESIYIHYTTEDLLKGFREEALRHRKEIEQLKDLVVALWHNENARFLNKEQIDLLNDIVFGNDEEDLGSDKEWVY